MIFARTIIEYEKSLIESYKEAGLEAANAATLEEQELVWRRHNQKLGALYKSTKCKLLCDYITQLGEKYKGQYEISYRVAEDILIKTIGRSVRRAELIKACESFSNNRKNGLEVEYHRDERIRKELLNSDIIKAMVMDYYNIENWLQRFKKMKTFNPEIKRIIENDKRKRHELSLQMEKKKAQDES